MEFKIVNGSGNTVTNYRDFVNCGIVFRYF